MTSVAILAVLATVIVYTFEPETLNDRQRYATVADALGKIATAITYSNPMVAASSETSFWGKLGVIPGKLSDLTTPITATGKNICGTNVYQAAQINAWQPFYFRDLRDGTPLARGFALQDALVLVKKPLVITQTTGKFAIRMTNVAQADAVELDRTIDAAIDNSTGLITYSSTNPTSVDYNLRFRFFTNC